VNSAVVLLEADREAADIVVEATRKELLEALCDLPSYQRAGFRWLAHVLAEHRGLTPPVPR
jgi:hypothetical protein